MAAIAEPEARELSEAVMDTVREPLVVLDKSMNIVSASRSFFQLFQVTKETTRGAPLYALCGGQWDIPALRDLLEDVLPQGMGFENHPVECDFPATGRRKLLLNARRIVAKSGETQMILLAMGDDGIPEQHGEA